MRPLPDRRSGFPFALAFVSAALLAGGVAADRETAEFIAQRAEKALAARSWQEAERLFRKALEEDGTLLSARAGLGETLIGAGERAAGIAELRQFVEEAGPVAAAPPALAGVLARAKKRLTELDTLGTELETK